MSQSVKKTMQILQIPCLDQVVDVPVVMRHHAPTIQTEQKMVEVSQSQYLDRVVNVPMAMQRQVLWCARREVRRVLW